VLTGTGAKVEFKRSVEQVTGCRFGCNRLPNGENTPLPTRQSSFALSFGARPPSRGGKIHLPEDGCSLDFAVEKMSLLIDRIEA
jgi:hypothetical protein